MPQNSVTTVQTLFSAAPLRTENIGQAKVSHCTFESKLILRKVNLKISINSLIPSKMPGKMLLILYCEMTVYIKHQS